ncbi:MAG: right-handed parallel beta-helix repeat-containing protein, partial [Planctomycetes bacterium]|nr:right-handed parallel beta-helix repeat-containing protein [Planctomycetota bacterium]
KTGGKAKEAYQAYLLAYTHSKSQTVSEMTPHQGIAANRISVLETQLVTRNASGRYPIKWQLDTQRLVRKLVESGQLAQTRRFNERAGSYIDPIRLAIFIPFLEDTQYSVIEGLPKDKHECNYTSQPALLFEAIPTRLGIRYFFEPPVAGEQFRYSIDLHSNDFSSKAAITPNFEFHVAVHGDDRNPGTAAEPFATIAKARDVMRSKIQQGLTNNIKVEIHAGRYSVPEPLVFGPEDSGTLDYSVTYCAEANGTVVLDGGRPIGGWKKNPDGLWTATIPEVQAGKWYPRQLFVNGQRAIRARTPNHGWCEAEPIAPIEYDSVNQKLEIQVNTAGGKGIFGHAREFEYEQSILDGGVAAWGNPTDIELVSLRHNEGGRKKLLAIDSSKQTVTLQPPHRWAPKVYGNDWFNGVPDGRCYFENAREFLDSPGEWYLDRKTGVLTYMPKPGEDPNSWNVAAPLAQNTLLAIRGTRERPVMNLHFRGLHIEHVDWELPEQGYGGLFCCNVPVFRDEGNPGHRFIEAAVEMTDAISCSFVDGGIARVGGMGLVLGERTADITVERNLIEQTGAGGIGLGQCNVGFGYLLAAPEARKGEYERFRICNNYVHHCGLDYFGAVGIALFRMKDSTISHNLIHDTTYCGVVFPGDQDPNWNFVGGNVFESNHIYNDMRVTQDGAGLYASFAHRGTAIRGNLIHDSSGNPMSGGICLDGSTGMTFDHNVVYRNPVWSLVLFRPSDLAENIWTGNLVMPTRASGVSASRPKTLFDGRPGWELQPSNLDVAPPAEFLEAMRHYAGLESAYRKRLQGRDGSLCHLHVLDDGLTWQFDFPELGRGVVYRIDATAGKGLRGEDTTRDSLLVKLRGLVPNDSYRLSAYVGPIQMSPTDSSVGDFTSGALFPTVHEIRPVNAPGPHESATGKELMENGFMIPKDPMIVYWMAYQRLP